MAALALAGAATIGLGRSAVAQVTVVPPEPFECHATITVVPSSLVYGQGSEFGMKAVGWNEFASLSGSGTCHSDPMPHLGPGEDVPITFTGSWMRFGSAGGCPPADFQLNFSTGQSQQWHEFTNESDAPIQIIGINPIETPPVPFGTGAFVFPVATSYGLIQTDPAACQAWPSTNPPPTTLSTPPPFHVIADWNLSGLPVPFSSLVQACVTVQGVVPRTCVVV